MCTCAFLFLVSPSSLAESQKIRVGVYENYPKIFTDADGRVAGFFPFLLDAMAELEGWEIEYRHGSWQEGLDRLSLGEIDILPDVALSAERQTHFLFNKETALISWASVYTRLGLNVQSFQDLAGLRIGLLKGGIYSDGSSSIRAVLERLELSADFIEYDSYAEVFAALSDRSLDVGVVNNIFGSAHQDNYDVLQTPVLFQPSQLRFAFSRSRTNAEELISRIDHWLRNFKQESASPYHVALDRYLYGMTRNTAATSSDVESYLSPAEQQWITEHPDISLGIDPEFYPFVFRDEQGNFQGIGAEYILLLNKRLGLHMEATAPMLWEDAMDGFRRGEIDVLPCVGVTAERSEYALFTKAFVEYQRVILTRADMPFVTGIDDISTWTVGVQADTSHDGYLYDHTIINPVKFTTLQEALLALSSGKIDALVGNLASSAYWIRRLNLINLKVAAPVGNESYTLHFAVRKDWPELVTLLDKGLDLISPEEKQAIRNQWVSIEYRQGIEPRVAWRIGLRIAGAVLAIWLAMLVWSYLLKKEIKRREVIETQLQFRVGFERLVSETLSRFISVPAEKVDMEIQVALTEIAMFTGVTAAYICQFNNRGVPDRTHTGGELKKLEGLDLHPSSDRADALWLSALNAGESYVTCAGVPPPVEGLDPANPPPWLSSGYLLEFPYKADENIRGFFGLVNIGVGEIKWRVEDISLFKLVGQIFGEALRHKVMNESLHRYASDLESANRRLQELDRLKSLFIASVSHELRTPLNSIIGFTGVMLKGMAGELNIKQQDQMNRVYTSAKHLLALITDIIDISKIEAGHIDVHLQEIALDEVIKEAVESIQPMIQDKGLHLETCVPSGIMLNTDRKRLRQCVLNYLSNAVKYSEKGTVKVEAWDQGTMVEISVSDTGIGISPEDQIRLFNPFIRLDSHLRIKAGGTGLGLYLTRKIAVDLLHGRVLVTSQPGRGSVFSLIVPKRLEEIHHRQGVTPS